MASFLISFFFALFLWWFTTGAIFVFYGRSKRVVRAGFAFFTGLLVVALIAQAVLKDQTDTVAIYLSVTAGVVVWGWQVASYYLGYVTGPRWVKNSLSKDQPAEERLTLTSRFRLAALSGIYHEAVILGFVLLQALITTQSPNRWGLWVFIGLWIMHTCGKISVFLGVRNFQIDFLPEHLAYVGQLISQTKKNAFLPIAVVIGSTVGLMFYVQARSGLVPMYDRIGSVLVGTMILLGVIELCLLVIPLPATLIGWQIKELERHPVEQETVSIPITSKPLKDGVGG